MWSVNSVLSVGSQCVFSFSIWGLPVKVRNKILYVKAFGTLSKFALVWRHLSFVDFVQWLEIDVSLNILMRLNDPADVVRAGSVSHLWLQFGGNLMTILRTIGVPSFISIFWLYDVASISLDFTIFDPWLLMDFPSNCVWQSFRSFLEFHI